MNLKKIYIYFSSQIAMGSEVTNGYRQRQEDFMTSSDIK